MDRNLAEQMAQRLREFWESQTLLGRSLVLGIPALLIAGLFALIGNLVGGQPRYSALFRNLEQQDAAAVVEQLKKDGVQYKLENEGHDILVPADAVYDLRLGLAGQGLPRGSVGFELFDKQKLGLTESGLRIDYQRALQGELARTLESLQPVEKASVLLNIAPETSFLDSSARSTASVTLHLYAGAGLNAGQVRGVQHLVSRAVSRLAPDDVAVVDGYGAPLSQDAGAGSGAGLDVADKQRLIRRSVERDMEEKIRRILEAPYGADNLALSVAAEIDFATMSRQSENYTPVLDGKGIERSVQEKRERSSGSGGGPGGVPGTTSNIPGYLGISGEAEGSRSEESKYDLNVDYLVNKEVRMEDLPPGAIKRLSAAVAISTTTWDDQTKSVVEQLVASAIGADTAKGDVINVQAFEFAPRPADPVEFEQRIARSADGFNRIISWVMALVLAGLVMFMLRGIVTRSLPPDALALAAAGGGKTAQEEEWEQAEEIRLRGLDTAGATSGQKMREEIDKLIERNPQQVASLLRSWMLED